ncbi:MAG: CBS domain-containing protein [Bacillota bacterium]
MQIKNIMTRDLTTINPDTTIKEAAKIMKDINVGSIPVTDGNKPVGIITDRDITIRNVAEDKDENTPVKQIMTKNIITGSPDMSPDEAARIMSENQIRRLPIVENNELIGIVALGDLAVQAKTNMEAGEALSNISTPSKPEQDN